MPSMTDRFAICERTTPAILGSMKAQLSGDPDMARAIREAAAD
jgi:hypothetical protein